MSGFRSAFRTVIVLGLAALPAALIAPAAQAAPGDLDPTFGSGGVVTTPIGPDVDSAYGVAVQSDGKIVVVGRSSNGSNLDFAVVRYTTTGALDSTFGSGGKVTTAVGSGEDVPSAVAIQSDGKIVAAGYTSNGTTSEFALVRYTTSGTLDSTFGTGGKVTTVIGSSSVATAVAIQSDGKIVAAGYSRIGSTHDFALVRYTTSGALDPTFGEAGVVTTAIGSGDDAAAGVAIQTDVKIVAAGYASNRTNDDFALVRYTSAGVLDGAFGTGGKVTTPIGSSTDEAFAVAIQSDGKIVAAGIAIASGYDFALVRYTTTGALDPTFGSGGKVVTDFGSGTDSANALAIQSNGKIVAAGYAVVSSKLDFALARYTSTGALDPTFGTGGKVTTALGSGADEAYGVALQSDGKIVAAGLGSNGSDQDFGVARYLGDSADLSLSLTDDRDPMPQYGMLSYAAQVSNAGPDAATGIGLHLSLPSGVTGISIYPIQGTCSFGTGTVDCSLGSIASSGSAFVVVRVVPTTTGAKTLTGQATANEPDSNTANNSDSEGTQVNALACTMVGTNAANTLSGTTGDDVICGLGGNDTINGNGGNDVVVGGPGNDNLIGGDGNDTLLGGDGDDTLNSADGVPGNDVLAGGAGTDNCTGDPASHGVAADGAVGCP
jgi:uncharacterized delta-60 repeat protein